ncbi:MAG TPA: uroporphyrinogen-III synthase, partial [Limnochordia bacterium]|nr:uroporphyrinogen-III synthase [Limnochordia bacterium]
MTGAPRPLQGRRVLLTRPADQAVTWADALAAEGAAVECVPAIRILPPASSAPLRAACRELTGYEWVAFTSVNAVR